MKIAEILDRYYTGHSDRKPNPSAARRAGSLLLAFVGRQATVSTLTREKQEAFILHLHCKNGLSVAYISRVMAIIAAAINRAEIPAKILTSTAKIAEHLDAPEPEPNGWHPTLEQVAAHVSCATSDDVRRFALITLVFAARPEAVRELSGEQYDHRFNLLSFNPKGRRQTKKHRPTLPVPESFRPLLAAWAEPGGKLIGGCRGEWAKTCEATGVHFPPKALRHFMATEMRKAGVPLEQRELWMGHRRRATNDLYGQFTPDHLQAARDCADAVLTTILRLAGLIAAPAGTCAGAAGSLALRGRTADMAPCHPAPAE